MDSDFELITKLRIQTAVLEAKLGASEKALHLAHSNTIAWVTAGIAIASLATTILIKFFN